MMRKGSDLIEGAKHAALRVLLHNIRGPYRGLPRAAGWGYPEPYTRDIMISSLGMLASGNAQLIGSLRRVLETLARNQTSHGHIPSLVHDGEDRGASDTTPLFLLAVACYRIATKETSFLENAVREAVTWMDYQSPADRVIVAQQPTSDWRDEQWVLGYGLFVNAVVYSYMRLHGEHDKARVLQDMLGHLVVTGEAQQRHSYEGLRIRHHPCYALWSYKVHGSQRFDLLGNSLAILSGLASPTRAEAIIAWVETQCGSMRRTGDLALDLPPCLIPFIRPQDPDWQPRYAKYNLPGEYHNGGIWPFVCGFYVAALVAAGKHRLAETKLKALAEIAVPAREADVEFGFNEWFRAQDGKPRGQDWQTWSAAMYLYAAACVETGRTPFFDEARNAAVRPEGGERPRTHPKR